MLKWKVWWTNFVFIIVGLQWIGVCLQWLSKFEIDIKTKLWFICIVNCWMVITLNLKRNYKFPSSFKGAGMVRKQIWSLKDNSLAFFRDLEDKMALKGQQQLIKVPNKDYIQSHILLVFGFHPRLKFSFLQNVK